MYGCESWTIKKAECWRIDAFQLWCWRRLLRVPWIARRLHSSILKGISPEYSLEGLMLKLKLQYFDHLMQRTDSFKKTVMLGKIEGRRRRERDFMQRGWDGWMASLTQWAWVWASSGRWWRTGRPAMLHSMGLPRVRHNWSTELNWWGAFTTVKTFILDRDGFRMLPQVLNLLAQNTRSESWMFFKGSSSEHQVLPTKCPWAISYLTSTFATQLLPYLDIRISGKS